MKKIVLFLVLGINFMSAQKLTFEQTSEYINNNLYRTIELNVAKNGQINFIFYNLKPYGLADLGEIDFNDMDEYEEWKRKYTQKIEEGKYSKEETKRYTGNIADITLDKKISFKNEFILAFNCKGRGCWTKTTTYTRNENELEIEFLKERKRDKLFNAFSYLLELIKNSEEFNQADNDPFSDDNFNQTLSYISSEILQDDIEIIKSDSRVHYLKVYIGSALEKFILDTGASDTQISSKLEKQLIARNIISKEDYIQPALYQIANGSIINVRRVILKNIKVGDFTINNIVATIGNDNAPLLLGKNFLDNFSKWSIDNSKMILTLEK